MSEKPCAYVHSDGTKCNRTSSYAYDGIYNCCFHRPLEGKKSIDFNTKLRLLIDNKDGNWDGFIFPEKFKLENGSIDFPINCRNATFQDTVVDKTEFHQPIDFEGSIFEGDARIEAGVVFHKSARFYNSRFMKKALFKCLFKGVVSFHSVVFSDSAIFKGHRHIILHIPPFESTSSLRANVSVSNHEDNNSRKCLENVIEKVKKSTEKLNEFKKGFFVKLCAIALKTRLTAPQDRSDEIIRVFNNEVELADVEFERPDRVKFHIVDLSKARVVGTLFRGVSFQDVLWNKRKGIKAIYDEVWGNESKDKSHIKHQRPQLAETYRNLRVTLENNKDYSTASDFYVGEMEAVRKQKNFFRRNLFSIEAIYKLLSNYGTHPFRATTVLLLMILGHSFLTWLIIPNGHYVLDQMGYCFISNDSMYFINTSCGLFHNSLKVVSLQRFEPFVKYSGGLNLLDTVFRVFGPIQIALIVLALRGKVKRH